MSFPGFTVYLLKLTAGLLQVDIDFDKEPIGTGKDGKQIFFRDIWPSNEEVADVSYFSVICFVVVIILGECLHKASHVVWSRANQTHTYGLHLPRSKPLKLWPSPYLPIAGLSSSKEHDINRWIVVNHPKEVISTIRLL